MAFGAHDAKKLIERAEKLVYSLEAGVGRSAFVNLGYGEGDHAQGQRVLRLAQEALAEAERPPSARLRIEQYFRAVRLWGEDRSVDLKREGFHALKPQQLSRFGMDLATRLRQVARGAVANDQLQERSEALKKWLDRWTPAARKAVAKNPELSERLGIKVLPVKKDPPEQKQASA